jgi:hypothetical protein
LIIEERTKFLGDLIKLGRGTKEVEGFIARQEKLRHESYVNVTREEAERMVEREREMVKKAMENKVTDNILKGARKGRELHQLKGRLMWRLRREEDKVKLPPELHRYKKAEVFQTSARMTLRPGQAVGPVVVGLEDKLLDRDEIAALVRGPKFCVRRVLDEERYLIECEKSYFKLRLDMKDDDEEEEDDPGGGGQEYGEEGEGEGGESYRDGCY